MNHEDLTTKHTQKADELSLLDRVVLILEQARANVVRAVNSSMVTAYWLIGREIVLELQGGDEKLSRGNRITVVDRSPVSRQAITQKRSMSHDKIRVNPCGGF
jgi:hypothetical protein